MNKRHRPAMRVWVVLNIDGVPMSVIAPRTEQTRETLERHWCMQLERCGYVIREAWLKIGTETTGGGDEDGEANRIAG